MPALSDEELIARTGAPRALSDEELVRSSPRKAAPQALSDEELLGAKPQPTPSDTPVRSGQDQGVVQEPLPIPNAPLPRERPTAAGPRVSTDVPDVEASWDFKQKPGAGEGLGNSFSRGYEGFRQNVSGGLLGVNQTGLEKLDKIERQLAEGKTDFTLAEDPEGFSEMTPEQRKNIRQKGVTGATEAAVDIAQREVTRAGTPANAEAARIAGSETWTDLWHNIVDKPTETVEAIIHLGAESAIPSGIGAVGALGGGLVGGMPGAFAGAGLGSFGTNFASEILDSLREQKVDLKDPAAIRAAFANPEKMKEIYDRARLKAGATALVDAASVPVAGIKLLPKSMRPTGVLGRVVEAPLSLPIQGGMGALSEVAGSVAVGEKIKPGAVGAEFLGEFVTGPMDIASAAVAKGEKVAPTVTAGEVAAGVAGTEGIVGTPANPPPPGGPVAVTDTEGNVAVVASDPTAPAGTVPPTVVPSEEGVVTTVAVTPGTGLAPAVQEASVPDGTLIPVREQEGVIGSAPAEGLYSRVFNYVKDKGPVRATAQRWLAWVERGEFTQEEVNDLKLKNFLRSVGPREKITREDVLAHLDANAITLEEIERRPATRAEKRVKEEEIDARMYAYANANPDKGYVITPWDAENNTPNPKRYLNENDPVIAALFAQRDAIGDESNFARFESYTTPGPREGYVELTMHTPNRVSTDLPPPTVPKGSVEYDPDGDPKFPWRAVVEGKEINRTTTEQHSQEEVDDYIEREVKSRSRSDKEYVLTHFEVKGELFTMRVTIRRTKNGQPMAVLEELQSDIMQRGKKEGFLVRKGGYHIPSLPFKESWASLGFNRFLMWAAERGIRHVAWADSSEQLRRYPRQPGEQESKYIARVKGMAQFYDRQMLGVAKKWKSKFGATLGYTEIPNEQFAVRLTPSGTWGVYNASKDVEVRSSPLALFNTPEEAEADAETRRVPNPRFRSLTIPQTGIDYINAGMPTHAQEVVPATSTVLMNGKPPPVVAKSEAELLVKGFKSLVDQLNIGLPVNIIVQPDTLTAPAVSEKTGKIYTKYYEHATGLMFGYAGKSWEIRISLAKAASTLSMWITMTHELGHVIEKSMYARAPLAVRQAVDAAYAAYLQNIGPNTTVGELFRRKQNPIDLAAGVYYDPNDTRLLSSLSPADYEYHTSKTEWFADQISKWATSKVKPLSTVEKFFKGLGRKLMQMFSAAAKVYGVETTGVPELMAWLDTQSEGKAEFFAEVMAETNNEGTVDNSKHMGPEETPPPAQIESAVGVDATNGIFNGNPPVAVKEAKAYADKFNWMYKWMMGVHQMAQRNPHLLALQEYVETLGVASRTKQAVMIHAQEILKRWNKLGGKQGDIVGRMLDEVQNMDYLTPAERTAGVSRLPTLPELQAMAQRLGVTSEGFKVFMDVTKSFQDFLSRVEAVQRAEANKVTDPTLNALAHKKIDAQMKALRSKPYFPAMRFGNYTLTIRNAAGKVVHFETFERKRDRDRALPLAQKHFGVPDAQVKAGFLDKQSRPLLGVPTQLLELLDKKLSLTSDQRESLEQLKFELSPAQSFRHRFQHKRRVAGYSQDFRRAYATYFFHGANHIVKAMHSDRLRELAVATKAEGSVGKVDITKLEQIVAYMNDHTEEWLNPSSDWAWARGIAFTLMLAFSPAAAAQNLTQTLMTSYPFLASKFGDAQAVAALVNAGRKFETFYRKGTLEKSTAFETQALYRAMEAGIVKESQAPELAGYADGDILGVGFGGSLLQRNWLKFNELGAMMFEMAEQVNRRLIFRAALQLALSHPNAKYVQEAVVKNKLMYDEARATMTEEQAAAYVTAVDATTTTQFQYSREYAPRAFRGHMRTVLVFKTFVQSYLMFLANYPAAAVRSILLLGFLGGFMALPGADELKDILKVLAYRIFGKDFDLEKEGRKFIIDLLGEDENGRQTAELIMHGIARKGYGIPAMMDLLGGTVGIDLPVPTFDRSSSISMGSILPIDLSVLGEQTQSTDALIAKQAQKVSGAFFGAGFNIFRALMNYKVDIDDTKRWERAMPRALGDLAEAYRVGTQGYETRSDGSKSVEYDVRDTQQMAEVIGIGMGYTPYRKTLQREIDNAQYDAVKTWEIRQQSIIRSFGNAVLGKDDAEIAKMRDAVRKFNDSLPPEAKGFAVTSDSLKQSIETKAKGRAYREEGFSTRDRDNPVMMDAAKMYPESQRKVRRVKPALTP
jgi:hypothetical protein